MQPPPAALDAARQSRSSTSTAMVEVREYRCSADKGEPPEDEQFSRASISIVRAGIFEVRTGRHSQLLTAGFLLLGNAGQHYEVTHNHAGGDSCLVFSFAPELIEEVADTLCRRAPRNPFALNVLAPRPRAAAIMKIAEERFQADAPPIAFQELGLALSEYAVEEAGTALAAGASEPSATQARDRIIKAIGAIEAHSHEELDLAHLASIAGMSPYHFVRMFKRETGVTPYKLIIRTRIRNAIDFLRDTDQPVTEIAYDVGFGDLSNFINAFRREVGCSPREFRKSGVHPANA